MGKLVYDRGMDMALAVLHSAQVMMDDDDNDIAVLGVSGNKTTGLHFIMDHGFPTRKASVLNDPVGDGLILVYGEYADFQPNNNANDTAARVEYNFDEVQLCARALLDWLLRARHPQKRM